jgi:DNA polymerase III subunit delta
MMSINPSQLAAQLKRGLANAYLLAGEEPLLLQEAADVLRDAARQAGYTEREVLHVETGFDWDSLRRSGENLSLFASRRLLEVRLGDKSPGPEGAEALTEWLASPQPDTILVVHAGKLDKRARESAWFNTFERSAVALYAWPIKPDELPRWIEARLRAAGLDADRDAVALLAQRTEGNLLACAQEIEKLKLLCPDGRVDAPRVLEATADSARFDIYDLVDTILEGRAPEVLQVLERLREEGVDVVPIVFVLAGTLRQLYRFGLALSRGAGADRAIREAGIWKTRQGLFQRALRRLPMERLLDLIREAAWLDRVSKGAGQLPSEYLPKRALRIDPWPELIKLATRLAGVPWQPARP